MIKDPLFSEETPYDILDLDPNALHSDVLKALQNFMRIPENIVKIPKAQAARRQLMNTKDRIAIDILYYWTGKIDIDLENDTDLKADIEDFKTVSVISQDKYYSDLKRKEFTEYFSDISFNKLKINDLKHYDKLQDYQLEIFFDK